MSIVVYTAFTDGYDKLQPVNPQWNSARFVEFSNQPLPTPRWEHRQICSDFADPCRNAKIHKIVAHRFFPDAEYTVWIDGCIRIVSEDPIERLVETWLAKSDMALFRHRVRSCIYEEGRVCIERNKDRAEIIERQMNLYRTLGYPKDAGLAECTVLVRRNTPEVRRFCEAWYAEISQHSRRDQLSFNYVARTLGFNYSELPGNLVRNRHFYWLSHHEAKPRVGEEADPGWGSQMEVFPTPNQSTALAS